MTHIIQKETHSHKELERDAALKELEAKKASVSDLEKQVKDLTQNLQAVTAKAKEQVTLYIYMHHTQYGSKN